MNTIMDTINFQGLHSGTYVNIVSTQSKDDQTLYSDESNERYPDIIENKSKSFGAFPAKGEKSILRSTSFLTKSKPHTIERLESVLTQAYGYPATITQIYDHPTTKKKVKEVYFEINNSITKIWVFKADPKETEKELKLYQIAHDAGLPTCKPVGYEPSLSTKYPYDVAILGGVLEDAGETYDSFLKSLELSPLAMLRTTLGVAKLIAEYHFKLSNSLDKFGRYGIRLLSHDPAQEINERLVPVVYPSASALGELEDAVRALDLAQELKPVVSHNDIHLGNIITKKNGPLGNSTSLDEFGIMDLITTSFNNPYSDLHDFWTHYVRKKIEITGKGDPMFHVFEETYLNKLKELGADIWTPKSAKKDSLIQKTMWNVYELYDPTRNDPYSSREKEIYHAKELKKNLKALSSNGLKFKADKLKKALKNCLKNYGVAGDIIA